MNEPIIDATIVNWTRNIEDQMKIPSYYLSYDENHSCDTHIYVGQVYLEDIENFIERLQEFTHSVRNRVKNESTI